MGSNRNRRFTRFATVLVAVCVVGAVGAAVAAQYTTTAVVQSEPSSQRVDRSKKGDSLRTPHLNETVAPDQSKRIEVPTSVRERSAIA